MTEPTFDYERFCDDLGPVKVVHISDPACGLRAIVVVDNVACGPAIGGVRMAPDVTTEEVFRLARAMTFKNAGAGLPHGGGKAALIAEPGGANKERLVRSFARAIRHLEEYIPGPDMGTDESCMAWVHDETGRSVGLPRVIGGIPLDEVGATALGLAACADVAVDYLDLDLQGARLAIEGFGNVGRPAARFLAERGVVLVAASDSSGAIYDPEGIDVEQLVAAKESTGRVVAYERGREISHEELFGIDCEIFLPAARPDCIREDNVDAIRAKLVLQGANIPATASAEKCLHERGILSVPDFIANAGGVICGAVEYRGGSESDALAQIVEKVTRNTRQVLEASRARGIQPREAAVALARVRVEEAMALRGR